MKTLTGNDLALAEMAAMLAIAWHRKQPRSAFGRREIEKLTALKAKLAAIQDWAYPTDFADPTDGEEEIMRANADQFGQVEGRTELNILTAPN